MGRRGVRVLLSRGIGSGRNMTTLNVRANSVVTVSPHAIVARDNCVGDHFLSSGLSTTVLLNITRSMGRRN